MNQTSVTGNNYCFGYANCGNGYNNVCFGQANLSGSDVNNHDNTVIGINNGTYLNGAFNNVIIGEKNLVNGSSSVYYNVSIGYQN